jgi:hypothetical protein
LLFHFSRLPALELAKKGAAGLAEMHEVAITSTTALAHAILAASSFAEISDWRQFSIQRTASVVAALDGHHGLLSSIFLAKLDIHVTVQVVTEVSANVDILDLAIFRHLNEDVLYNKQKQKKKVTPRKWTQVRTRGAVVPQKSPQSALGPYQDHREAHHSDCTD